MYNLLMSDELVLVTGGTGFVGVHCIDQLLRAGYRVRTTVRSLGREAEVRKMLEQAGTPRRDALSFVEADLSRDAGWVEAVRGCRYVLHVASPFPAKVPKHEDELIVPARDGALRVLRAARDAGVERVVMTSSFVAIGYGHKQQQAAFDETYWSNLEASDMTAYAKSKTIAERAAWDFVASEGGSLELTVINPVGIFGPVLGADYAPSVMIIERLMNGFPFCPRIYFGTVDVRDVADLHLRAMTHPEARGQRFLAVAGEVLSFLDVSKILQQRMGVAARRAPKHELPDWVVRVASVFVPELALVLPELGKRKAVNNEKARRVLGWQPRSNEEAIEATAKSLLKFGLVKS
jgi:nucleoside-diphosphate-sugar epimerase